MALLFVNNQRYTVELPADTPLLWVLRDHLHLVGTKYGCGMALCGACTVLVDGVATRSCTLPISPSTKTNEPNPNRADIFCARPAAR